METFVHQAVDAVALGKGNHRAHLAFGIAGRSDPKRFDAFFQQGNQPIGAVAHRCHNGDRHAALARGPIGGGDRAIRGEFEIGVR